MRNTNYGYNPAPAPAPVPTTNYPNPNMFYQSVPPSHMNPYPQHTSMPNYQQLPSMTAFSNRAPISQIIALDDMQSTSTIPTNNYASNYNTNTTTNYNTNATTNFNTNPMNYSNPMTNNYGTRNYASSVNSFLNPVTPSNYNTQPSTNAYTTTPNPTIPKPVTNNYPNMIPSTYTSTMNNNFSMNTYPPKPVTANPTPVPTYSTTPTFTTAPTTHTHTQPSIPKPIGTPTTYNVAPKSINGNDLTFTLTSPEKDPQQYARLKRPNPTFNIFTSNPTPAPSVPTTANSSAIYSNNNFIAHSDNFINDNEHEVDKEEEVEEDEDGVPIDTRPIVECAESTVISMDLETLKKELLGEGSRTRWSDKTISFMKKEILARLLAKGDKVKYDRQERYLLKLAKQEFEDIPKEAQLDSTSNTSASSANSTGGKSKKYDSLEDLMSQCKVENLNRYRI